MSAVLGFLGGLFSQIARILFLPFLVGLGGALGLTIGSSIAGLINPEFAQMLSAVGQLMVMMIPFMFLFAIMQMLGSLVWIVPSMMTVPMYSLASFIPTITWLQLSYLWRWMWR